MTQKIQRQVQMKLIYSGVKAILSPFQAAAGRVTLTALIGGCLGSGIDEDRG